MHVNTPELKPLNCLLYLQSMGYDNTNFLQHPKKTFMSNITYIDVSLQWQTYDVCLFSQVTKKKCSCVSMKNKNIDIKFSAHYAFLE